MSFQSGNWSANRQSNSTNQHPASPLIEDITEYTENTDDTEVEDMPALEEPSNDGGEEASG